jgi:exopolysaccharide biosynthesis polyprenyl glycosylphosphotransferase
MPTRSARYYSIALILCDFLTLLLAFGLAYIVRVLIDHRPLVAEISRDQFLTTSLLLIPLWLIVFGFLGLYSNRIYSKRLAEWGRLFVGAVIGILIVIGYSFVIDQPVFPARLVAVYAFFGSFVLLILGREVLREVRTLLFRFGKGISRVLIIGNNAATRDIATQLSDTTRSGYQIVAIAGPKSVLPARFHGTHYRSPEEALAHLKSQRITTIIQTELHDDDERNQKILNAAQTMHISYCFIPGEAEFYSGKNIVDVFLGYPIISVYQTPLVGWGEVVKRVFDVIVTLAILIALSPLLLLIIIAQKIFNPGPIFFVNKRLGIYARPFGLYKLRSMKRKYSGQDALRIFADMNRPDLVEEYRKHRKVRNDPRITWFGKFLRITSIDELPQLFNVLRGDMSLVGPRPILPDELEFYRGRGSLLHSVKPGMTGLWQVSGRDDLPFEKRVELELYYAQNWSFWLDIKILLKTLPAIFKKGSAH